ncbi:MAG: hypothetical protein WC297_00080 [Candidatus Paceibacterota bacterium]|jgi:orotate phosphoribosyltransferase
MKGPAKRASELVSIARFDHLLTLKRCGGYYECPISPEGKLLGPLVGYAGKYEAPDKTKKQWVGMIYANFAKAEEYPHVLYWFAQQMIKPKKIGAAILGLTDVFCGAPLGGYDFAKMLGLVLDRRAIKAEKKVTAFATADMREQSTMTFARHEIKPGDRVTIVEDVCNNFSTTDQLIQLIEQAGGSVTAITCLLNRSLTVDSIYTPPRKIVSLPVISLVRLPIAEFKQEDSAVADDIVRGNVVLKPKDEWGRLMAAMDKEEKQ